jgi:hypothetical protein
MRPRWFKNAPHIIVLASWATLGACASTGPDKGSGGDGATDSGAGADGGGADGAADGDSGATPPSFHGTRPDEALPAPDFAATNRDGAARDREDLLGGPTVMWFYPAATTAG